MYCLDPVVAAISARTREIPTRRRVAITHPIKCLVFIVSLLMLANPHPRHRSA
jgi:hypothetical protein